MKVTGWKKATFEINYGIMGKETVSGWSRENFGVDQRDSGDWVLIHLPTGWCAGPYFRTKRHAQITAQLYEKITDWSKITPERITDDIRVAAKELRAAARMLA